MHYLRIESHRSRTQARHHRHAPSPHLPSSRVRCSEPHAPPHFLADTRGSHRGRPWRTSDCPRCSPPQSFQVLHLGPSERVYRRAKRGSSKRAAPHLSARDLPQGAHVQPAIRPVATSIPPQRSPIFSAASSQEQLRAQKAHFQFLQEQHP